MLPAFERILSWRLAPLSFSLCVLCVALLAPPALAVPGLPARPANPDCTAPPRPGYPAPAQIMVEDALPTTKYNKRSGFAQSPLDPAVFYTLRQNGFINRDRLVGGVAVPEGNGTFIDLQSEVIQIGEGGLLNIVFHPNYATNFYAYLYYTSDPPPASSEVATLKLVRYTSTDGGNTLNPSTAFLLWELPQSDPYHQGGGLAFGPDGYLYIGVGEGQGDGWQFSLSQDVNSFYGSILRIDVDGGTPYAIPPTNPFAISGGLPEIYAWGVRNPWRMSFDPITGDLWLGEVGWRDYEEIDLVVNGGNYGWPVYEGYECVNPGCSLPGHIEPEYVHAHISLGGDANAIIGGYVYRGSAIPDLYGHYVYGDWATARIFALSYDASNEPYSSILVADAGGDIRTFAEGADGELYLATAAGIKKIVPAGTGSSQEFPDLLSETGCFDIIDPSLPGPGLIPYTVNTPLWSDGAEKLRYMAVPDGELIDVEGNEHLGFPIGTVLVKTFSLSSVLVETRLLVRHEDGQWAGYSYQWDEAHTDATYVPDGAAYNWSGHVWNYPSTSQCTNCHTLASGRTLGPWIGQLNGDLTYPSTSITANQLETLDAIGILDELLPDLPENLTAFAPIDDTTQTLNKRTRSYLHSNCSNCHLPGGPTQANMDLRFDTDFDDMNVCDVDPLLGDLGVAGAKIVDPTAPSTSIMSLRMHATNGDRMPPLGTEIVDPQGTALIDAWIGSIVEDGGGCVGPDSDGDGHVDDDDNCDNISNASQTDTDGDGDGNECDEDDDGDGLLDVVETGTLIYVSPTDTGTDPLVADTDLDGFGDGYEVANGFDPTNPASSPQSLPMLSPTMSLLLSSVLGALSTRHLITTRRRKGS
jgi:uncharacterized repeat protein (TIGR03806 family)